MDTGTLRILVCGGNEATVRRMARMLADEGVQVQTSNRLIDRLCFPWQEWDVFLIDLDGLNGFLRSLLPAVFRRFPDLPTVGISTQSATDKDAMNRSYGLELDAYFSEMPRPEDLIVLFPQVAAKYLCDPDTPADIGVLSHDSLDSLPYGIKFSFDETPLRL